MVARKVSKCINVRARIRLIWKEQQLFISKYVSWNILLAAGNKNWTKYKLKIQFESIDNFIFICVYILTLICMLKGCDIFVCLHFIFICVYILTLICILKGCDIFVCLHFILICVYILTLICMLKGCDIFVCLQFWRWQTWVGTANTLDKAALVAHKGSSSSSSFPS